MYKVEVYGYDGTQSSQLQYSVPSPVAYYTCLRPSKEEDTSKRQQRPPGTLFTLGRKLNANDCVVSQEDRSISREHLRLQLVTANKTVLESTELSIKPAPCDRSTPEQIEACQKSSDHMALVATNLGKLGTYRVVVIEQPPVDKEQHTQKDDQDMKDDDSATTADSKAIAASQKSLQQQLALNENLPLSNITKKLIGNAKAKLELIAENQSFVLNTDDNRNMEHPVILQCGKMGTTVVITKIQIHLIPSGLAKKDLENKQHSLFAIHGVIDPELPDLSTKNSENHWIYLVTNEYKAGLNQLAAWCQKVPFVQVSFVEALLARTSPSSPLPDPTEFAPEPDSKLEFWLHTTPNPNLWKSCTFFSVSFKQDRQYEAIVIAAGGNVHRLYDQDGETVLEEEDVMQQARRLQKNSACFCIGGGRRKFTKLLKDEGVAIISSKELAAAVIEQRMIQNPLSGEPILEKSAAQSPINSMDSRSPETPSPNHNSFEQIQDRVTFTELDKKPEYNNNVKDFEKQSGFVDSKMDTKERTRQEVTRIKLKDPQRSPENEFSEDNSRNYENEMEISDKPHDVVTGHEIISGEPGPQKDIALQKNHRNRSVPKMNPEEIEEGGWIPALPKKRKQFVRSADEIKESNGWEEVRSSAPTDLVEGMIVYNSSAISQLAEGTNSSAHNTGPNYKRFRKNSVPVPRTKFIELRPVLTKESEYQRDMERQRQAIEEQQRRADELFSDGPSKGRRRHL